MQSEKDLDQLRKQAGRINQSEYSALTKTQDVAKARNTAKRYGRVNATEYAALTAKPRQRKAARRKRVAGK
jgi:hypothetical protein